MSARLRLALLLVLAATFGAAASALALSVKPTAEPVVRTVLAEDVDPPGAPGRTLGLSRVTVEPGAQLALHRHPGVQIANIARGTLTYWVVSGSVTVHRGDRALRTIRAGQRGEVRTGEWIVERPGTIHHAANRGKVEIEILIATLFKDGAPPSIPVRG
ncbi:cupin domain-containing protein [Conexibacter sp. JD483]|uniref:cupin domain-containing protein n=1 Tax=unclassified Conexibacter TaxID=2627773 RepID=UPI00271E54E4|nr:MULTISPECIES: cupin domain-containing protein [unclassified Conexibacter]MDO8187608.1 cupin domain-containing protein [Conexibacter sp. CPCC 205706]MDO8201060.1 cupin domain-containing protein [Conexibacter sp. CPCC 205762]MDR9371835.1 cupin domain-containing protein [Conexibacter sp. JD483]